MSLSSSVDIALISENPGSCAGSAPRAIPRYTVRNYVKGAGVGPERLTSHSRIAKAHKAESALGQHLVGRAFARFHGAFHAAVGPRQMLAAEVDSLVPVIHPGRECAHIARPEVGPGAEGIRILAPGLEPDQLELSPGGRPDPL